MEAFEPRPGDKVFTRYMRVHLALFEAAAVSDREMMKELFGIEEYDTASNVIRNEVIENAIEELIELNGTSADMEAILDRINEQFINLRLSKLIPLPET